jgi:hypothetical protein
LRCAVWFRSMLLCFSCTVRYSAVRCGAVQGNAALSCTVRGREVRCSVVQGASALCCTVRGSAVRCCALLHCAMAVMWCSVLQCFSAVVRRAVRRAVRCGVVRCGALWLTVVRCSVV